MNKLFELKRVAFNILQSIFSKSFYLIHSNSKRQLFIDLDANKKFDFEIMLYYVKKVYLKKLLSGQFSSRHVIESIFFFSRLFISVETRYWSIEFEIVDIVWIFKKIKHIIEIVDISTTDKIVIYTNHDATLNIVNQTSFTTSFTDKFNLRLVRVSNYIQRFDLDIRHKFDKQHIVSNVLFRLISDNVNASNHDDDEFDALFITSFVEMKSKFKQRILNDYKIDFNWKRISKQLNVEISNEIVANLSFCKKKNDLIFRSNDFIIDDHVYESRKLCIFHSIVQNILELIHDDEHFDYVKCFEQIIFFWYIRELFRYLKDYFKHCSNCQVYQIKKHASYESLQFILISTMSFHTIIINFILTLSIFIDDYDTIMSIFCKFIKKIIFVLDKFTWFATQWEKTLLNKLDTANWKLLKVIIFDRNRKFLSEMWTVIFRKLKVKLFYFTAYHSQTDDQFERTNQTIEIVLRFHLAIMKNSKQWSIVLSKIQRHFNNVVSVTTDKSPNETVYEFTFFQVSDFWKVFEVVIIVDVDSQISIDTFVDISFSFAIRIRVKIVDSIVFAQMKIKRNYDDKHKSIYMREKDYALIKLHHEYDILFTTVFKSKLSQQFVESFRVLKRVERFVYKLNFSAHWRIHSILFIAQLESVFAFSNDFFNRSRSDHSNFVFVESDIERVKFYEIDKLIDKRQTKRRDSEYLVRWKSYDFQFDEWRNLFELDDVMKLIRNYENVQNFIVHLFDRLQLFSSSSIAMKFLIIKIKVKRDRFAKLVTTNISASIFIVSNSIVKLVTRLSTIEFVNIFIFTFTVSNSITFNIIVSQMFFAISKSLILSTFSVDALLRKSSRLLMNKWVEWWEKNKN